MRTNMNGLTSRALAGLLLVLLAGSLILLATGSVRADTAVVDDIAAAPAASFTGYWVNEDAGTDNIPKAEIRRIAGQYEIHMWGACVPSLCDWGIESTPVADDADGQLKIAWEPGFKVEKQTLSMTSDGRLRVEGYVTYTDGRPDRRYVEFFRRDTRRNRIFNVELNPMAPAVLAYDEQVTVKFDYTNATEKDGVYIWARPVTGNSLTPSYAAHGSALHPPGTGSDSGYFTITAGPATVDRVRLQMWDKEQTIVLYELFVDAAYFFDAGVENEIFDIKLTPPSPANLHHNDQIGVTFKYTTNEAAGVRIWARPMTSGALSPNYAAHGSPLHPATSGNGSGSFTISSGEVKVDQVRLQMWDDGQNNLLYETFVPVDYDFAAPGPLLESSFGVPFIDGSIGFGEWNHSEKIQFENGYLTARNDGHRLYLLLNVTEDDSVAGGSDYYWVSFDVDDNNDITPNVDLNYGPHPTTGNLRYQYYLGPGSWTGLQPNTFSSRGVGFGCFVADGSLSLTLDGFIWQYNCEKHRVFELAIDLDEIGAAAGDEIQMGVRVASASPGFVDNVPADFYNDFGSLIRVQTQQVNLPLANSQAQIDLENEPVEVTQAIQTRDNDLPLVADKETVARVYADVDNVGSSQPVRVFLYGSRGGIDLPGSPMLQLHTAPTSIDRDDLDDTANFRLPASWDSTGTVSFQARLRDLFGNVDSGAAQNLAFTAKQTPTYWVVPLNTGSNGNPTLPTNNSIDIQESYLETIYPVPEVDFVRKPWTAIGPTSSGQFIGDLNDYYNNAALAWLLTVLFTGEEPFDLPDQIYGVPASGGGLSDPTWVGGNGRVAYGAVSGSTSQEGVMAHEIMHNLDRSNSGTWGRHAPGCGAFGPDPNWPYANDDIQETGFDTRLPWNENGSEETAVDADFPDIMSYCQSGKLPTKWLSPYHWTNLFDVMPNASLGFTLAMAEAAATDVYYVTGQLNRTGGGTLNPILVQPGLPSTDIPAGDFAVDILDENDNVLESFPFIAVFEDIEGEPLDTVFFNYQIPVVDGGVKIVLREGETILDVIAASDNPPQVTVDAPNGGESWSGLETISWTATDLDGDELTFNILYSPDGGASWFPVAAGVGGSSYEVDSGMLPGGDEALIRIIASDGFHTAEDDSDAFFSVSGKAPEVTIAVPDGGSLTAGEMATFSGQATDVEDGDLPDEAFVWTLDGEPLGTGREVDATLPAGSYTLALVVTDSDGQQGTAEVSLTVQGGQSALFLPFIVR